MIGRPWALNDQQKAMLRDIYPYMTNVQIAELMCISWNTVRRNAYTMKLGHTKVLDRESGRAKRNWEPAETQFLRDFYNCIPAVDIAEVLGRKTQTVIQKAFILGVSNGGVEYPEEIIEAQALLGKITRKIYDRHYTETRRKQLRRAAAEQRRRLD